MRIFSYCSYLGAEGKLILNNMSTKALCEITVKCVSCRLNEHNKEKWRECPIAMKSISLPFLMGKNIFIPNS